tara:strand:- start:1384 stop:2016 length:633 start_codon:yes stop_codon:yes gene_type:complete
LAKRLTETQIQEIITSFSGGKSIDALADKYKCSKLTISRNLKKNISASTYKDLISKNKFSGQTSSNKKKIKNFNEKDSTVAGQDNYFESSSFFEITPLNEEIDFSPQRDLSSIPISEVIFPKVVYMVVDKTIELEIKTLKDYPNWQFLSENELNRKTIMVFFELRSAKSMCNKEQKVIKVPNPEVFKIAAPILNSKGISRLVTEDKLIAL